MAPMKPAAGGEEAAGDGATWQETPVSTVASGPAPADSTRLLGHILRLISIVLTLVATIVMGVAKETVLVEVTADYTLEGQAKSTYNSSYVYFIIVNTLACVYSAVSGGVSFVNQNSSGMEVPLSISDILITVLLFTGNASATAIHIVAEKGNGHFGWAKICNLTSKFCDHVTAAIVLSTVAAVAYALILVLSVIRLHKN
ncbi:hypothetical protein KSP39_PZI007457 [Platanthera zijinensis]|uniref:CASP-like protein n=1 Tax=Platanthera zijinensis TaxID=2320716 RepID=A0AAP0BQQ9_9ASPA